MAMKAKLSIKKNDRVMVIAGREKGKIGKVLKVFPEKGRVLVEKINMIKRHAKATKAGQGGIMEKEAPLHASNVMIMCAKCGKTVRVGHKQLEDGNRVRVCAKCGEEITS
jgi:large subunit ribosomal protein L24